MQSLVLQIFAIDGYKSLVNLSTSMEMGCSHIKHTPRGLQCGKLVPFLEW